MPRVGDATRLNIGDGDGAARGGDGGQHGAALLDVDEGGARGADGAARGARGRAGELDGAEVGEGHEGAALLEVLDDPLGVVLAERGLAGERVRDGLARAHVRDLRRAAGLGRRGDGDGDGVAGGEGDAREVVGVVGVPLVPGCAAMTLARSRSREPWVLTIVGHARARDGEVDTGLENRSVAGITVNTDPRRGGVATGTARGLLRGRDDEGTSHGLVGSLDTRSAPTMSVR